MEGKIANWLELGIMPYNEAIDCQNKIVEMRRTGLIGDTIISVQHPTTINFGANEKDNQFSDILLERVMEEYGDKNHSSVLDYLQRRGIPFTKSNRGGGATVFSPGQFVFYPIVNHPELTQSHELDIVAYKNLIYGTLFRSLSNLGVEEINIGSQQSFATRNERRDVWIVRDGVTHKMGSKGIAMIRNVAYHGFAIHANKKGIEYNWMVNQCGYRPHEVRLWSVEQELGRQVKPEEVYEAVQRAMKSNFGYSEFKNLNLVGQEVRYAS